MSNVIDVTDDTFHAEVVESDLPVLLDFWAPWCGPCKMIISMLGSLGEEFADELKICKINIEENEITTANFRVRTVPTLMIVKSGQVIVSRTGAMTRAQLAQLIKSNLSAQAGSSATVARDS